MSIEENKILHHETKRYQKWIIPLSIYSIAAILITTAGWLYFNESKKIAFEKTESQLTTLNRAKINEIDNWFSERKKDLTFYVNNDFFIVEVENFLSNPYKDRANLQDWLHNTQQSHNYDIFIVTPNSKSYFISGNDNTPLGDTIVQQCVASIRKGKSIFIDISRRPNTTKLFHISIEPIRFRNQDIASACLVFRTNISEHFINEVIFESNKLKDVSYSLIKKECDSVFLIKENSFFHIHDLSENGSDKLHNSPFYNAIKGKEGTYKGEGTEEKEIIASIGQLPRSSWYLAVYMDTDSIQKPLSENWPTVIGYPLLIILIFILWHLNFVQKEKHKNLKIQLQLNDELINNRETLQTIIQSSPLPLIVISKDKRILIWNRSAANIFGWTFVEINNGFNPLYDDENIEEWDQIVSNLVNDSDLYIFETRKKSKEGRLIDLKCWVTIIHNPTEQNKEYLFIFDDITERKQVADELLKLNEELENRVSERTMEVAKLNNSLTERAAQLEILNSELESFTYSVSHDLKAPLRSIQGFSDIILQEYSSDFNEEVARLFQIIRKNAWRMDQLIKDLLDLSRISRVNLKCNKIDMDSLVTDILKSDFSNTVVDRINIQREPLLEASGDLVLIRQVWVNLISNAIKYSHKQENPTISISSRKDTGFIEYNVKDNGVGFNPEYIGKLFNLFQRLHSDKEFEGTGVGLAIVKRIIKRHNGDVWAEGEEGKGATFHFTLPERVN